MIILILCRDRISGILPALLFIILFGLILGNINVLRRQRFIRRLQPDALCDEVQRFHELNQQSLPFWYAPDSFCSFGFLLENSEFA
jgi:hypothetical protein